MTREEVLESGFTTWYTPWMQLLAKGKTRKEIERELKRLEKTIDKAATSHLRAVQATNSMGGSSQRRAQSRNVVAAAGDLRIALRGALEIHDLSPEYANPVNPGNPANATVEEVSRPARAQPTTTSDEELAEQRRVSNARYAEARAADTERHMLHEVIRAELRTAFPEDPTRRFSINNGGSLRGSIAPEAELATVLQPYTEMFVDAEGEPLPYPGTPGARLPFIRLDRTS